MFRVRPNHSEQTYRLAVMALLGLSLLALIVTIWVMVDFSREQAIVGDLMRQLPREATNSAEQLVGELRWQFRLTFLIVLNSVVTFVAMILLWRAYQTSQDSLRDLRALAGDILGSIDQAIITTDVDGTVMSINERGIEMLGIAEDCVGESLDNISETMPLNAFRTDSRKSGISGSSDFVVPNQGTARTLRVQCGQLTDFAGRDIGNVLQVRDVTHRQLTEARMRRMERYTGLGPLAGGLHHEIKNPLAALSLHVQLLEEHLAEQKATADAREMIDVIKVELNRISCVLEGFRDFASLDQLNLASVDLAKMIQHQVALISPLARNSNVQVAVQLADDLPSIEGDGARLEQVLVNLFVNAIEAMPAGGSLTIQADENSTNDASNVRLTIADTGIGIPADLQGNVLDPYFSTKRQGTGMGLAYCDKIIQQHGGAIALQSSSAGTIFEMTLPMTTLRVPE